MLRQWITWLFFILIIATSALWFVVLASRDLCRYFQLDQQITATIERSFVKEISSNQFGVIISYSFEYQGRRYLNEDRIGHLFPNPWAAQELMKRFEERTVCVWIEAKHPQNSALEKIFPFKKSISALVLSVLTLYFILLGFYTVGIKGGKKLS